MKNKLHFWRILTIISAIILAVAVECIPIVVDEHFEKHNRVVYALLAILISLKIENFFNQRKLNLGLVHFIIQLKQDKVKFRLKTDVIRAMMKSVTKNMAGILEQDKRLDKQYKASITTSKHSNPCSICDENHETNSKSKCKHCKIDHELWKKVENN